MTAQEGAHRLPALQPRIVEGLSSEAPGRARTAAGEQQPPQRLESAPQASDEAADGAHARRRGRKVCHGGMK